jgi:hypothetical protein
LGEKKIQRGWVRRVNRFARKRQTILRRVNVCTDQPIVIRRQQCGEARVCANYFDSARESVRENECTLIERDDTTSFRAEVAVHQDSLRLRAGQIADDGNRWREVLWGLAARATALHPASREEARAADPAQPDH